MINRFIIWLLSFFHKKEPILTVKKSTSDIFKESFSRDINVKSLNFSEEQINNYLKILIDVLIKETYYDSNINNFILLGTLHLKLGPIYNNIFVNTFIEIFKQNGFNTEICSYNYIKIYKQDVRSYVDNLTIQKNKLYNVTNMTSAYR